MTGTAVTRHATVNDRRSRRRKPEAGSCAAALNTRNQARRHAGQVTIFTRGVGRQVTGCSSGGHGRHAHNIVDADTRVRRSRIGAASGGPMALFTARGNATVRKFGSTEIWRPCISSGWHKRTRNAVGVTNLATDVVRHRNVRWREGARCNDLCQTIKGARCHIDAMAIATTGRNAAMAERPICEISPAGRS